MNFERIGHLVRLRYKLMWAGTRTRNGKIAMFFAGYVLLIMVISLLAAGGVGAGMVAIRSGHGATIAGALLTGIFVQGILASVLLGFGMATIFSEGELRRFPLRARERLLIRHFIGIADPFWILFFVLDLGMALGLYLFGAGSLFDGLLALPLLFVSNYLAARVVGLLVERLTARKFGSMVMLVAVMCLGFLPSLLAPVLRKNPALLAGLKQVWWATPPAAAGVAMTSLNASAVNALGVIVLWTLGLAACLVLFERLPRRTAVAQNSKIVWADRADRIASVFGPDTGPLVAHWLRFYWRKPRFRVIYPLALPLSAILLFFFTRQASRMGSGPFVYTLAVFGIVGFVGTGQFAVNQFGYVGGGFRRFLLLPTDPAAAFRAGSYTFVALSAVLIPPAALLWMLFGPIPWTARMMAMLIGMSVSSLFLVHGAALWVSVLGPRRGNYQHTLGNDLSFAGNITVIGSMLLFLFGPQALARQLPGETALQFWWAPPVVALLALAFYGVSLRLTTVLFRARRESLMVLMEGKG